MERANYVKRVIILQQTRTTSVAFFVGVQLITEFDGRRI
jgi:hypothetical protein